MTILTLSTTIVRAPDLIAADMDGETVMMSIERGEYFGLGGVGSRAWELLAEPTTMAAIVQVICSEYEVDKDTCQTDMHAFLEELMRNGLVTAA